MNSRIGMIEMGRTVKDQNAGGSGGVDHVFGFRHAFFCFCLYYDLFLRGLLKIQVKMLNRHLGIQV